ncbi:Zinc finger protein 426 [Eumeta japonica]|uniref:Zinc finger protein 426 n=1 Tax=Eumeta variegata TaxID=151549 RepID=A0A4C1V395_EUMVA|nr:Zinc finger protein 426 [Eumeta japonica]
MHSEEEETFQNELKTKCNSLHLLKNSNMTLFRWCKNRYRCFCCKETFLDPKLLKTHSIQHNLSEMSHIIGKRITPFYHKVDVSDLKCKICFTSIDNIDNLIEHLKDHNLEIDGRHLFVPYKLDSDILKCQMCSELYKSYVQLDKHMNTHYKNHICETCGKSFKTHEGLRDHAKRHKEKQHVCKKCDVVFSNYYRKRQHDIAHHNLKVGHVCPHCPETFNSYHNRLWHLVKVHNYEKPEFKCVTCEKVFYNNSLLRSHIRKYHLQERNVQCSVCNTKFFRKCDLTEHMKNHTKERKFVCTFCGKSFIWKKNLNIHLAIHNNVRRHVCNVCGKSFVQGTSLKYHIGRHHAKDGQTVS